MLERHNAEWSDQEMSRLEDPLGAFTQKAHGVFMPYLLSLILKEFDGGVVEGSPKNERIAKAL